MTAQQPSDPLVQYCESCGRVVPVRNTRQIATRTLCLRCALAWQTGRRSEWPPPGFVWDGAAWHFDLDAVDQRAYAGYQPTAREVQWWCFLSWLIAAGRMSVGATEGAEEEDRSQF